MKYVFVLVFSLFFYSISFCQESMNDLKIGYVASSRGFYEKIEVSRALVVVHNDRKGDRSDSIKLNTGKWNEITALVNKIKLKNLPYLKAPSEKRMHDGAHHAQLIIVFEDRIYESSGFDHGNPPNDIRALINYILDLSRNNESKPK